MSLLIGSGVCSNQRDLSFHPATMNRVQREALRFLISAIVIAGACLVAPWTRGEWVNTRWNEGVNVKPLQNGEFKFNVPTKGHVNSIQRKQGAIRFKSSVTFTCRVTGKGKFVSLDTAPAPPALLPNCRVMIQRKGDDWKCTGDTQNYRWWSTGAMCVFLKSDGQTYTYNVKLIPENWSNCWGKMATEYKSQFRDALANTENVQLVFGGGNSFAHGVRLKSGDAQFQLLTFSIK